jgi:hypothetical protein
MPVLRNWELTIEVDQVLRCQGANPAAVRQRNSDLIQTAERALAEGLSLIEPAVAYHWVAVEALQHEKLILASGAALTGPLVAAQLAPARLVALAVCTIGPGLERRVSDLYATDPVYAFGLDGVGTAAVDALSAEVCGYFDALASQDGLQSTSPISPGMIGWPLEEGQRQIFSLLDTHPIGVVLNAGSQMIPRKSTSMAIGISPDAGAEWKPCDFCSMRETCRFRGRRDG